MNLQSLDSDFLDSHASFEKYPRKLVLKDVYGASRLRSVRNRLQDRQANLFVEEDSTLLAVKDIHSTQAGFWEVWPLEKIQYADLFSPNFFDFLDVYGSPTADDRELRFNGFKSEICLSNPAPGAILPDLGRSGRCFQLSYNLKTVALKDKSSTGTVPSSWKIRQAAIHHQFDVGSGTELWIYGDPHGSMKDRIAEIVLNIHIQAARWSTEGWRQYILSLEDTVERLTSHFILMKSSRESRLETDDLFRVQECEDKINECVMTLESVANNLEALINFYTELVEDESFPASEKRTCKLSVNKFAKQIGELIYDINMQARRATVLAKIKADRKAMFIQLLQAQAASRAEQLSTTMWRQAERTSYEAIAMRVITVITLLYLPPTFVSTLFSTDIVKYQGENGDAGQDLFSSLALERFLEVSLPLMLLTLAVAFGWMWYERSNGKKKVSMLELEHPDLFGKVSMSDSW
ncbi:hypothetical protein JX265_006033 [Neoarthrinium moseri]|uniref:CorA-like transporter domain-containing protein n=1 Tax=Neoarthrinium moseri TaxID=1658444 RepID=A0A9P9WMN8_9PEZI|nr:hypothetical protein JX265_006033 [Neoarthrinium moseri]